MAAPHLRKGSPSPQQLKPASIRLYSSVFCPFSQRVRLVLTAKNIPHEVVNIHLLDKPEWLIEKSPLGSVPVLEVGNHIILGSGTIVDFLDEKYSDPPLYPHDPLQKAVDRSLLELFGKVMGSMGKMWHTQDASTLNDPFQDLLTNLDVFEKELLKRTTKFYGGDSPGYVDFMIYPWCERAPGLKVFHGSEFQIPHDRYPQLEKWRDVMLTVPAVQRTAIAPKVHGQFLKTNIVGCPDYEMGFRSAP